MTVHICPDKDAACGEFPVSLRCADCPTLKTAVQPVQLNQPLELSDSDMLDFLSDCVMNHGGINAHRLTDPFVKSPAFGYLKSVLLFTVPSKHVHGVGFRGAIIAAINAKEELK